MIFYLLLICLLLLLHALGAHRVKESADVIKHKPINRGAHDRDVEHTALALAETECNAGDNY